MKQVIQNISTQFETLAFNYLPFFCRCCWFTMKGTFIICAYIHTCFFLKKHFRTQVYVQTQMLCIIYEPTRPQVKVTIFCRAQTHTKPIKKRFPPFTPHAFVCQLKGSTEFWLNLLSIFINYICDIIEQGILDS